MLQHQPDLDRPETEIEQYLRDMDCTRNSSIDDKGMPVQIPGFTTNDPRIPASYKEALRQRAIQRKQAADQFRPRRTR